MAVAESAELELELRVRVLDVSSLRLWPRTPPSTLPSPPSGDMLFIGQYLELLSPTLTLQLNLALRREDARFLIFVYFARFADKCHK